MNHKRKGPKSTRSGCMVCKSHKHQRNKDRWICQTPQERKSHLSEQEQRDEVECNVIPCPSR